MIANTQFPRISVLMPVYNAGPFLEAAISSILNQSFRNFELLICDDGSTDNSSDILQAITDERVKIYHNTSNRGVVVTTNKLFKLCHGELITFQDADDWSENDRLTLQEKVFTDDATVMLCGSQCNYIKGNKKKTSSFPTHYSTLVTTLENGETSICCGASVMFRSTLLSKYGGYRSFFDGIGAEHLDFYWQMIDKEKFINLSCPLYNYRSTQHSFSQAVHNTPLKFYSTKLAYLAYWQRKLSGTDFLSSEKETKTLTKKLLTRHLHEPSLTSSTMATTQLAYGNTKRFIEILQQSIRSYGLTSSNIQALGTAIPLFLLCSFAPNALKRFLVRKSNLRFLKRYGIK